MELFYDDDHQDLIAYSQRKCRFKNTKPIIKPEPERIKRTDSITEPDRKKTYYSSINHQQTQQHNPRDPLNITGIEQFLATVRGGPKGVKFKYRNTKFADDMEQTEPQKLDVHTLKSLLQSKYRQQPEPQESEQRLHSKKTNEQATKYQKRGVSVLQLKPANIEHQKNSGQLGIKGNSYLLVIPGTTKNTIVAKPKSVSMKCRLETPHLLINNYFVKPKQWVRTPIKDDTAYRFHSVKYSSSSHDSQLSNASNNQQRIFKLKNHIRRKNLLKRDDILRDRSPQAVEYSGLPNISLTDKTILNNLLEFAAKHQGRGATSHRKTIKYFKGPSQVNPQKMNTVFS